MRAKLIIFLSGLCVLGFCGCSGPVVRIEYDIPNAVPLPAGAANFKTGQFTVEGYSQEVAGKYVRDMLGEQLRQISISGNNSANTESALLVGGTVRIAKQDVHGQRDVRQGNPTGTMETQPLACLVRRVTVNCVFEITADGTSANPIRVELEREYNSSGDPHVRGELGLGRDDDPAGVPDTDVIVKELIGQCVEDFCGLIEPVDVVAEYTLRGSLNSAAIQGATAADHGDYAAAVQHYTTATRQKPKNPDLWFNLAVVVEKQGNLSAALTCYEQARELSKDQDQQAVQSAQRVRKLIEIAKSPSS